MSEIFVERALLRAADLDAQLKATGRPVGLLHGLPISLKDSFRVRGTNSAIGLVAFLDVLDTVDTESFLVEGLRELGAIIYVKTTTPTAVSVSVARS